MSKHRTLLLVVLSAPLALAGPARAQVELERWSVDRAPALIIGRAIGLEAELFTQVVDAARLPDGGVAVLDAGADELRIFGADRVPVASVGGSGEGPGEFRGPFGVEVLPGDSIVVWDSGRGRLLYWSSDGDFLVERPIDHHWTAHEGHLLPDGSVVVPEYGEAAPPPTGRYRPAARLLRYSFEGSSDLGPFPYEEMLAGSRSGVPMPYAARSLVAAGGSPMMIAITDDTSLPVARLYTGDATVPVRLELMDTRRSLLSDEWDERLDELREIYGSTASVERHFADWGVPSSTAAIGGLEVDSQGRIWVVDADGGQAIVYRSGQAVATVDLPDLAEIFEIGPDYILGLHRGEYDLETVRVFAYEQR